MSNFAEFDVPDFDNPNGKKVESKDKPEGSVEKEAKPTRTPSVGSRGRTKPSMNFGRLLSRIMQPLLTVAGAWYVYNWFFVEGNDFNSEGSMIAIAVAVLVGLNVIGFVGRMFGKFFGYLRHLASLALLGYIIYLALQQFGIF
jgi:hypothetical protein